jgi:putative transposase
MKKDSVCVLPSAEEPVSFEGFQFPPEVISYAVWLPYRFPLNLRMAEAMFAARGIELTYETVRCWATKFGQAIAKPLLGR